MSWPVPGSVGEKIPVSSSQQHDGATGMVAEEFDESLLHPEDPSLPADPDEPEDPSLPPELDPPEPLDEPLSEPNEPLSDDPELPEELLLSDEPGLPELPGPPLEPDEAEDPDDPDELLLSESDEKSKLLEPLLELPPPSSPLPSLLPLLGCTPSSTT